MPHVYEQFKVARTVYETTNYGGFTLLDANRKTKDNQLHLQRLKKSITAYPHLVSPIIVNEKLEVIDGQHRLEVLRGLGRTVEFIIVDGLTSDDIPLYNSTVKSWLLKDYITAKAQSSEIGVSEQYKAITAFKERFNFGDAANMSLLSNKAGAHSADVRNAMKDGTFKCDNIELSIRNADRIHEIGNYVVDIWRDKNFISAMIGIFSKDSYDHSHFISRMSTQSRRLMKGSKISEFRKQVEDIYNYRLPDTQKVSFK